MTRAEWRLPPVERIVLDRTPGETRVAFLRADLPWRLILHRDHRPSLAGAIVRGRIARIERGLAAAFVDMGQVGAGWLPLDRDEAHEGEAVVVQVTRESGPDKLPRVSRRIAIEGRYLVLTPGRPGIAASRRMPDADARRRLQGVVKALAAPGEGIVLRTAAAHASDAALAAELSRLRSALAGADSDGPGALVPPPGPIERALIEAPALAGVEIVADGGLTRAGEAALARLAPDEGARLRRWDEAEPAFAALGLDAEIDQALDAHVALPAAGVTLWLERTRALLAVDVDLAGRGGAAERARADANLAAAPEIARQVRLRDEAGLIAIDFARMGRRADADRVAHRLAAAFADDAAQVDLGERIVAPGVLLLTRERRGPSLAETVRGDAGLRAESAALAALARLVRTAVRAPATRLRLHAAPAVAAALSDALAAARREAEERLGAPLDVRIEDRLAPAGWDLIETP